MYVRDTSGRWFEIDEKDVREKEVDADKVTELLAAERAEMRKKAAEIIADLDEDTLNAMREYLLSTSGAPGEATGFGTVPMGARGRRIPSGPIMTDCHANDCHANDCHANDCWDNDCWDNDCWDNDCASNMRPTVRSRRRFGQRFRR